MLLFSGSSHPDLAHAIANSLAMSLGRCTLQRFPDGEVSVVIEEEVRDQEVFLVQSTCPPVDNHLMELLAMADACRRAAAARITAVIPYFGYGRSDHRNSEGRPIMASVVAKLLESVGIDRVLTFDPHVPQMEGFFQIPLESLTTTPLLLKGISDHVSKDVVVVSPDAGRLSLALHYADHLKTEVAVLHKQRHSGNKTQIHRLVGDVKGRSCLIVDDLISTGGTLKDVIEALLAAEAVPEIAIVSTHTLLCAAAADVLQHSAIKYFITTDTVPQSLDLPHVKVVSVASRISTAIERTLAGQSLESLY
ncbi:MAG: ribose-phosphate pyrophosphokinase [Cyanobacteria bacterium Co-bin8]|nr:ribose-phosphate pyrophosphokinase [Cyanobacteria bacterium Co-bin8]